jgi:WD40 repeat protein
MFRSLLGLMAVIIVASPLAAAEPQPVHVDALGDPLPADAIARLGTRRLRHPNYLTAVALSPTGNMAAAGDGDRNLVFWDLTTGKELRRAVIETGVRGPGPVSSAAFSADGKMVAVVCLTRVRMWDTQTAKEIRPVKFDGEDSGCQGALFTPDGKGLVVYGNGNAIDIWPLDGGKKTDSFEAFQGPVNAVACSPDGKLLAVGDGNAIRLWDLGTKKQIGKFRRHNGGVNALAFSSDGKLLASGGDDQSIRVWEVESGTEQRRFGHPFTRPATQHFLADYNLTNAMVAFSPDSRELISSVRSDRSIRRWDVATGKELARYEGHQDGSTCVALSRDGKTLVAGAEDSCLRVWDVAEGKERFAEHGHRGRVFNVAFAADGKTVLSAGRDNVIRVWDRVTQKERSHFGAAADRFGLIAFAADGKTVATARHDDETIQIWDTSTGKIAHSLEHKQYGIFGLSFGPQGKTLAAISDEEIVRLWDVGAGKLTREFKPENAQRTGSGSVAMSGDGRRLAVLGPSNASLWDVAAGKELRRISTDEEGMPWFRIVLSSDGSILAALGRDNSLTLFSANSGKLLHKFGMLGLVRDEAMMVPESVAFSPDSRYVAAIGPDSNFHVWEIATGKEVRKHQTAQGWIGSIAFSPDGRSVATGGIDTTVLIWDVTGLHSKGAPAELSPLVLEGLWSQLRADDGPESYQALWTLVAVPKDSLPYLREQLRPSKPMDPKRFALLVADLDSASFAVRQKATEELENKLDLVEGDLRKLLEGKPGLEVRQRVEKILEKVSGGPLPPERLRTWRALTVLEQIGTTEAREHLEQLARGPADSWLTREARKSLNRMASRKRD